MTNVNAKVSVIIPCYNHAEFVSKAIQSVIMQDYKEFELIIADDFSKDNSVEVIDTFVDPRIKKFFLKENLGPTEILKFLIQHSNGEYIALLNSDDTWCQGKLKKQVEVLDNSPEIAACFTWADFINEDSAPYVGDGSIDLNTFVENNRSQSDWLHRFYYQGNCICHPSMMIRKKIYSETGYYNDALRQLPDFDFWVRLILKYPIHILDEIYVHHRRLGSDTHNTSEMNKPNINRMIYEFLNITKYMFDNIDDKLFIDGFSKEFINKDSKTTEELLCEKYFILLNGCSIGKYTKILAYQFFMDHYNDDNVKECFSKKFNYDFTNFYKDNGNTIIDIKEEIDGIPPIFISKFFIPINGGYSEDNVLSVTPVICRNDFIYEFQIDRNVKNIRFDPVEGYFFMCDRAEATINGKDIEILPQNAFSVDNMLIFPNLDPQYILKCNVNKGDIIKVKLVNPLFCTLQSLNECNSVQLGCIFQKILSLLDSAQLNHLDLSTDKMSKKANFPFHIVVFRCARKTLSSIKRFIFSKKA